MGVISLISGLGLVAIMQQGSLPAADPLGGTSAAERDGSRRADDAPDDIELQQLVPAQRSSTAASAPEPDSNSMIAEPASGGVTNANLKTAVAVAVAVPPSQTEDEGQESRQLISASIALAGDRQALPAAEPVPSHAGWGPCNCWMVALWLVVFLGIGSAFVVVNGISTIAQARFQSQGN